ncbi:hypothetical protein HHK36_022311 [Tetracentron sinense]|uniref:Uncharacterized protein n=1 Tax=Tetracentron sinense TaxID=13715 RepID=A0A834YUN9_TETSI|nr:hypothetical protein HHK36_022311 [Tetracentron sinense]
MNPPEPPQSVPPPKEPTFSCPVCMGPLAEEMSTKCGHIFCKNCIKAAIVAQSKCPTCRRKLTMKDTIRVEFLRDLVSWSSNSMWSCFRLPKEREEERHFLENGALLLEELIKSFGCRSNPIPSFSKKELERATNNYHQNGLLRQNFPYTLYKGTYEDRPILVKKFVREDAPKRDIGECINEVAVASQMSKHKNVLKLLGCCLETEIPTLVFEFPPNGCLSDHIFVEELSPSYLSWESRLRIATEIADAVAYLHNGTSKPIIHRFIHSHTILLDQHWIAKLFEFGFSISIPLGQTYIEADLVGTCGYTDPESLHTRRYTEKSDVYNFGVVLFEILTGKMVSKIVQEVNGVTNCDFLSAGDNEDDIREYLKINIVKGNTEQLMACTELAFRCIKMNPEERPLMMEAAKELRSLAHGKSWPLSFLFLDFHSSESCALLVTSKKVYDLVIEVYGEVENSGYILVDDDEKDIRLYLKTNIVRGNTEQLMACAELAIRCVKMNPEERPSMMEATKELRRIRRLQHDSL